jgi:ABC-type amino acid transport substrate-binding protein
MKPFLALLILVVLALPALAQTEVPIGGSPAQPPFTIGTGGLSVDLVAALNAAQTQFKFKLSSIPALRNRDAINSGELALLIFSNIDWGYDKTKVEKGPALLQGGDRYIALKSRVKDPSFFDGVGKAETLGVLGFSYRFANFVTDEKVLKDKYNTTTVPDEATLIKMIAAGRSMLGVVSSSALDYLSKTDPATYGKLAISSGFDSQYERTFVVSKKSPITPAALEALMKKLADSGKLLDVYAAYGLLPPKY